MSSASVDPSVGPGDFLQHQALIGNDDFFGNIMTQLAAIMSPCYFIRSWAGPHRAFKVDIITLLDIRGIKAAPQAQGCTWHIYRGKSIQISVNMIMYLTGPQWKKMLVVRPSNIYRKLSFDLKRLIESKQKGLFKSVESV